MSNGIRDDLEAILFVRLDADAEWFDREVEIFRTRNNDNVRKVVLKEIAIPNVIAGRFPLVGSFGSASTRQSQS